MIRAGKLSWRLAGYCLLGCTTVAGGNAQAQQPGGNNAITGVLRGVTSLFNRSTAGSPSTLPTSTIGIRGLGAEDIANAQPNPAAVSQMESLRLDETQARSFAAQASLAPVAVQPLPAPARPATAGEVAP